MQREAKRTLHTLSSVYQNLPPEDYDVLAIDNNSSKPLNESEVKRYGSNFHYIHYNEGNQSPVFALNHGISLCQSEIIVCHIDGARMLSPGILTKMIDIMQIHQRAFVYTVGFHLGQKLQNLSIQEGYDQAEEDRLLHTIDWKKDGYQLYTISTAAGSSSGYYNRAPESNCFAVRKSLINEIGGFDERFISKGGGLANLEIFSRYVERENVIPIVLVGEGTFHQYHGGISTNVGAKNHPIIQFKEEYFSIFRYEYILPTYSPFLYGCTHELEETSEDYLATQAIDILQVLIENDNPSVTKEYITTLTKRWSENYAFVLRCARISKRLGHFTLARTLFEKALALGNNDEFSIRSDLITIEHDSDNPRVALEKLDVVLNEAPRNRDALLNSYRLLRKEGEFTKAYEILKKLISNHHPKHFPQDHAHAASVLLSAKRLDEVPFHLIFGLLWSKSKYEKLYPLLIKYNTKKGNFEYASYLLNQIDSGKTYVPWATLKQYIRLLVREKKYTRVTHLIQSNKSQFHSDVAFSKFISSSNIPESLLSKLSADNAPDAIQKTMIPILGMHRSGTSCLTGALQIGGFSSSAALTWNYDNQKGNREEIDVISLNHKVLEYNGLSWRNVNNETEISWPQQLAFERDKLLLSRFNEGLIWLFKDPRTVITWPFWKDSGIAFQFIGSFRHPMKSALSLFFRNQIPLERGLRLWLLYNEKIFNLLQRYNFPLVCFDSTNENYKFQLKSIFHQLAEFFPNKKDLNLTTAYSFYESTYESNVYQVDFDHLAKKYNLSDLYQSCQLLYNKLLKTIPDVQIKRTKRDADNELLVTTLLDFELPGNIKTNAEDVRALLEHFPNERLINRYVLRKAIKDGINLSANELERIEKSSDQETNLLLATYLKERSRDRSISILQSLLKVEPEYIEAKRLLAEIYLKNNQYQASEELFEQVVKERPMDHKSFMALYTIARKRKNRERAHAHLTAAYQSNPRHAITREELKNAMIHDSSLSLFQKNLLFLVDDRHFRFKHWFSLCEAFLSVEKLDGLMIAFENAQNCASDPTHVLRLDRLKKRISKQILPSWFRSHLHWN